MIRFFLREQGIEALWKVLTFLCGAGVVLLVGLSWLLMPQADPTPFELKRQGADTLLLYEIAPGESVRFTARAGQKNYYLISHLLLPESHSYDPEADFDYAVAVTFADRQNQVVAEHVFAERSRQSKAGPKGTDWLQENAFLAPGEGQLTDDRVTMLGVATALPSGGHVTLSSQNTTHPLLLRIYRIEERPDIERLKRYKLLPEYRKETMARYMGYESLEQLSLSDLLVLFQRKWERVEAQTPAGQAPRTRRMYYQGFRLARTPLDEAVLRLLPGRQAAFNVVGPCAFRVVAAQKEFLSPLWLRGLSSAGEPLGEQAMVWQDDRSQLVDIPPGAWSLVLDNRSTKANLVRIAFEEAPSRTVGESRLSPDGTGRFAAFLLPERPELEAYLTTNEEDVRYSTLGFSPNQLLVIEFRALLQGPEDLEPRPFRVSYYDRSGKALRSFDRDFVPNASRFEWTWTAKGEEAWLSDAVDVLVSPPPGTRFVGVSSERPLVARAFVETGFEPLEEDAYPMAELPAVWRHRTVPRPGWSRVDPANRDVLAAQERLAKIVGQTRLELLGETKFVATAWRSPTARGGSDEELLLAEVFPSESDSERASDNSALRLSCAPNRKIKTPLLRDPSGDRLGILDMTYYVPPPLDLGGLITVEQEGKAVAKVVPVTRFKGLRIRKLRRTGELSWQHDFPDGDPRIFVRIEPGKGKPYAAPPGCKTYRTFTVRRLPPGGALDLLIDADPLDPRAVNLVFYGAHPSTLAALIDKGRLRRGSEPRLGRPTRATQELAIAWRPGASSSFLLTKPDEPLRTSQTAFVQLGSDLSKGAHTLTLRNTGKKEVWFRAFQAASAPQNTAKVEVKRLQ